MFWINLGHQTAITAQLKDMKYNFRIASENGTNDVINVFEARLIVLRRLNSNVSYCNFSKFKNMLHFFHHTLYYLKRGLDKNLQDSVSTSTWRS